MIEKHSTSLASLDEWLEGLGRSRQRWLETQLKGQFGYLIATLGQCPEIDFSKLPYPYVHIITPKPLHDIRGRVIKGHYEALPIATEQVDAVIVPNTLEISSDRHQVLRECHRILKPQGLLLVFGWQWANPHALKVFKVHKGLKLHHQRHEFISHRTVSDWARILGFDVQCVDGISADSNNPSLWRSPQYAIMARKQALGLAWVGLNESVQSVLPDVSLPASQRIRRKPSN